MSASIIPFTAPPVVVIRPIGHAFAATVVRRGSGREDRVGIFADPGAAARQAALLNEILREARGR